MTTPWERPSAPATAPVVRLHRADSDEALVAALHARSPGAGEALLQAYGAYVRTILMRILGPDPDIGDLAQDVFVVALESLSKLQNPRAVRGWLAQIAVFKARRRIRHRKQWRILGLFGDEEPPPAPARQHDFEASEALGAAYRALAKLGAEEQIAFTLRFVEGMDLAEVAAVCGVSLATIKRRLSRAEARFLDLAREEPSLAEWTRGTT